MNVSANETTNFKNLMAHLKNAQKALSSSAAASLIIQNDKVIHEWYSGYHSHKQGDRKVSASSQFNVASVRKTYIAFAAAYALFYGKIKSIDDEVADYLTDYKRSEIEGVTIRHLLTHTHGLGEQNGEICRLFDPGTDWKYNNTGVNMLVKIIKKTMKKDVADILREAVFHPIHFTETGWRTKKMENLIFNVHEETGILGPYDHSDGGQSNLFTSARELANWGCLHLNQGKMNGRQLLSRSLFEQMTTIQSPYNLPDHLPRNGYLWWVQGKNSPESEIGDRVPQGSFQILGYTGCACLIIPDYNAVAVRMFNQTGKHSHPSDFDYLDEIRNYGNSVVDCLDQ